MQVLSVIRSLIFKLQCHFQQYAGSGVARDSSAVRRLFVRLAEATEPRLQQVEQKAVGRQRNLGLVLVWQSVLMLPETGKLPKTSNISKVTDEFRKNLDSSSALCGARIIAHLFSSLYCVSLFCLIVFLLFYGKLFYQLYSVSIDLCMVQLQT